MLVDLLTFSRIGRMQDLTETEVDVALSEGGDGRGTSVEVHLPKKGAVKAAMLSHRRATRNKAYWYATRDSRCKQYSHRCTAALQDTDLGRQSV